MGLSAAQRKALKTAFAKWLTWQAGQIRKIVEKITGQRDAEIAKKITAALNAFWKDVRAEGMPGDIKAAVESATRTAWDRVRADVQPGEADVIDEKWMRGYFEQYYAGMEGRLIDANEAAVRKLLGGATEEEIDNLYEKLTQWPENRADLMARTEAAMAVNEAMVAGYRAAGYYSVWQAAPGCCRICVGMNGQIVTTLKPPLHKGCGCGVARGEKRLTESEVDDKLPKKLKQNDEQTQNTIEVDLPIIHGVVPKGATIQNVYVIAGEGVRQPIRDIKRLTAIYPDYDPNKWQKKAGSISGTDFRYEIHWYENGQFAPEKEFGLRGVSKL